MTYRGTCWLAVGAGTVIGWVIIIMAVKWSVRLMMPVLIWMDNVK